MFPCYLVLIGLHACSVSPLIFFSLAVEVFFLIRVRRTHPLSHNINADAVIRDFCFPVSSPLLAEYVLLFGLNECSFDLIKICEISGEISLLHSLDLFLDNNIFSDQFKNIAHAAYDLTEYDPFRLDRLRSL